MFRNARERLFEQLEARQMLAGQALANATALLHANDHAIAAVAAHVSIGAHVDLAAHVQPTILTATLSDATNTNLTGTVFYSSINVHGTTRTMFAVTVDGASPNDMLNVMIGTTTVGQVKTDADGHGRLVLSSDPHGSQQALPANFPTTVAAGDTVTVGAATATLSTPLDDDDEMETTLSARLSDANNPSLTGKVIFTTETEDGTTETRFAVSIRGATPNSMVNVMIGTTTVGQIKIDDRGNGRLVFSSSPEGSQLPFPANFPTLSAGTTITVGTATGTLALGGFGRLTIHH